MEYAFRPIGVIHTPFKEKEDMPIQGGLFPETKGTVEVYPEYSEGLLDLDGFSHIILLFVFHKSRGHDLRAVPFVDDKEHGVFAIRSPRRPNPIGLTTVKLESVEGGILKVRGVDMLDGTPLLDIKPHVPQLDCVKHAKVGWLEGKSLNLKSDDRFSKND